MFSSQRWAGAHFGRPCWSVHEFGRMYPGSAEEAHLTQILEPEKAVPPGSNHPWKGKVYCLAPEAPLFWRMPTGSEAFLEPPSVSGLLLFAWTRLKNSLCHTRPVGGTNDKTSSSQRWARTHLSQPCWTVDRSGRVCDMDSGKPAFSSLRGLTHQAITLLGLGLSPGAWGAPF